MNEPHHIWVFLWVSAYLFASLLADAPFEQLLYVVDDDLQVTSKVPVTRIINKRLTDGKGENGLTGDVVE